MSWTKTVFDHTLITSQFLNDLQDFIIALDTRPQLVLYAEAGSDIIPTSGTAQIGAQGLVMDRDPVVGDVLLGTQTGNYARVTSVIHASGGDEMQVTGIGHF